MKLRKCKWLLPVLILLLVLVYFCSPLLRVRIFVYLHQDMIEQPLLDHNGVPVIWGVDSVNTWEGEHDMTEFILFRSGFGSETTYYGCYYSWDDVPLAFQNAPAALSENGPDCWKWQSEGDNWGVTRRISDHWYYFKASF